MLPFGTLAVSSLLLTRLINSARPFIVREIYSVLKQWRAERKRLGIALLLNRRFSREQLVLWKEKSPWSFTI